MPACQPYLPYYRCLPRYPRYRNPDERLSRAQACSRSRTCLPALPYLGTLTLPCLVFLTRLTTYLPDHPVLSAILGTYPGYLPCLTVHHPSISAFSRSPALIKLGRALPYPGLPGCLAKAPGDLIIVLSRRKSKPSVRFNAPQSLLWRILPTPRVHSRLIRVWSSQTCARHCFLHRRYVIARDMLPWLTHD